MLSNFNLQVPRVFANRINTETVLRVGAKYLSNQVLAALTDEVWDRKLGVQNLLVKFIGLWVLKWQESTYHSVDYNTDTPHVCLDTVIFLPGDHFGGRVARRPAGRSKALAILKRV